VETEKLMEAVHQRLAVASLLWMVADSQDRNNYKGRDDQEDHDDHSLKPNRKP